MNGNGFEDFNVYDGQNTFTIAEYEGNRGKLWVIRIVTVHVIVLMKIHR